MIRMLHDDVIKWKNLPRYRPFVLGIHRSPVKSPHTGQWRGVFFDLCLNQKLSKQWRRRWFETPSRSLWRHCNEIAVPDIYVILLHCDTRNCCETLLQHIGWNTIYGLGKSHRYDVVSLEVSQCVSVCHQSGKSHRYYQSLYCQSL